MQTEYVIKERLTKALTIESLEIVNDSHKHIGHEGSKNGAGHFTVIIKSDNLAGLSRIAAHREVYQALADLIPEKVHALNIKICK